MPRSSKLRSGAVFTDARDESVEWFVKYADDEVVVSRRTDERYHKFNQRGSFEEMAGLDGGEDDKLESRFQFTGEVVDEDIAESGKQEEADETTSLLDL